MCLLSLSPSCPRGVKVEKHQQIKDFCNKPLAIFNPVGDKATIFVSAAINPDPASDFFMAGLEDKDMAYCRFTLLAEGENLNRDEVSREFILNKFQTAVFKPATCALRDGKPAGHYKINANGMLEFDDETGEIARNDRAIGTIVKSGVVEDPDTGKLRVDCVAGIWKEMFPDEAKAMADEFKADRLYFSIEIDLLNFNVKANGGRLVNDGVITAVAVVGNPAYGRTTRAHDLQATAAAGDTLAAAENPKPERGEKTVSEKIEIKLADTSEITAALKASADKIAGLEADVAKKGEEVAALKADVEAAKKETEAAKAEVVAKDAVIAEKDKAIETKDGEIEASKKQAVAAERKAELEKIAGDAITDAVVAELGEMSADKYAATVADRKLKATEAMLATAKEKGFLAEVKDPEMIQTPAAGAPKFESATDFRG